MDKRVSEEGSSKNVEQCLEEYEHQTLDKTLSQFYADIGSDNGNDYETDSLKVMQAALKRHSKGKTIPDIS